MRTEEHTKYANLILVPEDTLLREKEEFLSKILDKRVSLLQTRYKCLNIVKQEADDFATNDGIVNAQCEAYKLKELSKTCSNA